MNRDCSIDPFSSRTCERGTKSCTVEHGMAERPTDAETEAARKIARNRGWLTDEGFTWERGSDGELLMPDGTPFYGRLVRGDSARVRGRKGCPDRAAVWLGRAYLILLALSFACLLVAAFGFIFRPDW